MSDRQFFWVDLALKVGIVLMGIYLLFIQTGCGGVQSYSELAEATNIEGIPCFWKDTLTCEHDGSKVLRCVCGSGFCAWTEILRCDESCGIPDCWPQ